MVADMVRVILMSRLCFLDLPISVDRPDHHTQFGYENFTFRVPSVLSQVSILSDTTRNEQAVDRVLDTEMSSGDDEFQSIITTRYQV